MAKCFEMKMEKTHVGPVLVLKVREKVLVDVLSVEKFKEDLQSVDSSNRIVLDLENVHQLGSSIISALVVFNRATRANGGRLVICNVGPLVMTLIRVTRLDKLLLFKDTLQEAIEAATE